MQTMFPLNLANKLAASNVQWSSYGAKDWLLFAGSIVLLLAYEGVYLAIYHYSPHRCTLHRNIASRKRWVEGLLRKKGSEVLVVQTLRNGILAANFFAGTTATIALFILGFLILTREFLAIILDISFPDIREITSLTGVEAAQLWSVCVLLFLSFLNWVIVIRNYNHLSFHYFNELDDTDFQANPQLRKEALKHSQSLLSRATVHHFLGTRCLYLVILIIGWKISTIGMIGASLVLVPWLAYHDFV